MKYIKTLLWIFALSVIYASGILRIGGISAELLFIFSGAYAYNFGNVKSSVCVSTVCALIMSALGGRSFAFCCISCTYFAFLCIWIKKGKRQVLCFGILSALCVMVFESLFYLLFCLRDMGAQSALMKVILPCGAYTLAAAPIIFALLRKSFKAKERFIFR